jgi:dTMP kinase
MKTLKQGLLISIEGIDGSGKSTLAQALRASLEQKELPIYVTFEPGDTELGARLRMLLQEKSVSMCDQAEYLLFAADRAQHYHDVLQPLLAQNNIVISDRLADSSLAFQGYGRGLNIEMIRRINDWTLNTIKPDITIYTKISLETALNRLKKRKTIPTAFEQEKAEFTQRVINGFEMIFQHRSDVVVIDGEQKQEKMHQDALTAIMSCIIQRKLIT